jgi:hypothetical protein
MCTSLQVCNFDVPSNASSASLHEFVAAGTSFTGWSGACTGTGNTCIILLSPGVNFYNVTAGFYCPTC